METIKGFKDYTGEDATKREVIREVVKNIFERYGFEPAETPVVESEEFVTGENKKDEAVSDIFRLQDKGNRKLALRYEFTFQLKRLMQNKKLPYKRFQIGPVFRDEPVSGNRTRQFVTCEADIVGVGKKDRAEVLAIIKEILDRLKIKATIYLNSRRLLNEIIRELNIAEKDREQVIRELDKLDKLPRKQVQENLKRYNAQGILNILSKEESYFKKYGSYSDIEELEKFCEYYGLKFEFTPSLARGLSYYNGIVFEIKTDKIRETVFGGGEYMFNNIQSMGFGASIERLSTVTNILVKLERYLVVSLNKDKEAIQLAQSMRKKGKSVSIFFGKPTKALEYANSNNISRVIFIGEKEVKARKFLIKDMKTGRQKLVTKIQLVKTLD